MGTDLDRIIATKLGRSVQAVVHRRNLLGITAHTASQRTQISREQIEATIHLSESEAARELGTCRKKVKKLRNLHGLPSTYAGQNPGVWTAAAVELLGTMPDVRLAHLLGVTRANVADKRNRLGVAPYARTLHTPTLNSIIVTNIRRVMRRRRMTQQNLAAVVGINRSYLAQILTGHRKVTVDAIEKIAKAFAIAPHKLLVEVRCDE